MPTFLRNKTTLILGVVLLFILGSGLFIFQKFVLSKQKNIPIEEINLPFDPEGPYALLIPRSDGNALNLNITRVGSYEEFSYELVYQSSLSEVEHSTAESGTGKVDRSAGNLDTYIKLKKQSEFKQEILFGTCSQGYTSGGAHCAFDKDVENGTLTLRIKLKPESNAKVIKVYKMITTWHLQKPALALGIVTSADNHFIFKSQGLRQDLANISYTIVNDLSGAPKLPDNFKILGKVYALNVPNAKTFTKGDVTIELVDNPSQGSAIYWYNQSANRWDKLETKINSNKLTATATSGGIFAVLSR